MTIHVARRACLIISPNFKFNQMFHDFSTSLFDRICSCKKWARLSTCQQKKHTHPWLFSTSPSLINVSNLPRQCLGLATTSSKCLRFVALERHGKAATSIVGLWSLEGSQTKKDSISLAFSRPLMSNCSWPSSRLILKRDWSWTSKPSGLWAPPQRHGPRWVFRSCVAVTR